MPQTVEVRFKGTRRAFFRWLDEASPLRLQEAVIVPAEHGLDLGRVSATGAVAERKCGGGCGTGCAVGEAAPAAAELPAVVRRATQDEVRRHNELRRAEEDDRRAVVEQVRAAGLPMKVSDAEWQWDRQRLTIFFTAEQRVDFRGLVKELAGRFKARIDLRQIGARDEAARLTGVGRCGREYCCSTWLTELSPVSLSLAKDQRLALNPSQISGGCGRLLCCLKYEHEFYVAARKRFPREGKTVDTARGKERVVAVDILRERVVLRHETEGSRIVPLVQFDEERAQAAAGVITPPAPPAGPPERGREERAARPQPEGRAGTRGERAPAREPRPPGPQPPAAAAPPAADGAPAKKRRRRRRRRKPGEPGAPPSSPEA